MSILTCPVCKSSMREIDREGVTIDVCTQCRGVWLDRGELEKLSAALAGGGGRAAAPPVEAFREERRGEPGVRPVYERPRERRDWDDDDDDDRRRYGGQPYKKSKMSRLLDFFD